MRLGLSLTLIVSLGLMMLACGGTAAYIPDSFRDTITSLIQEEHYCDAVAYLESVDPAVQAAYDEKGYLAVAEDLIVLPGVYPDIEPAADDWCFPGTQDAIQDKQWQDAATEFAARYNVIRREQVQE